MSSPAPFDWKSLITPAVALGSKAIGDIVAPDASLQNARSNSRTAELSNEIARSRMANANQIRSAALPGMYTNLGYSPAQGRNMASGYSAGTSTSNFSTSAAAPSGGSKVGKTILGAGLTAAPMLPGIIGHGASLAGPATGLGGLSSVGSLGMSNGLLGLGAATLPVVGGIVAGIGLLAKHYFGNGGDRQAANQLTGSNGVHEFFTQASEHINALPEGQEKTAAINARDRAAEQALVNFSKIDKDHYYQAQKTLQQFSQFSTVRPLLG